MCYVAINSFYLMLSYLEEILERETSVFQKEVKGSKVLWPTCFLTPQTVTQAYTGSIYMGVTTMLQLQIHLEEDVLPCGR